MHWIAGWDRQQQHFLPECLEDYVTSDNPVRFLDAFVDSLDLRALGFQFPKDNAQDRGRPSYHPGDLLKLYLYGYSRQIRSSRRLEAESHHNLEVIWLLKKLAPDHKVIADFRKLNATAFKAVVRQFNRLCQDLDLFGGELIAIDGTKIKGQNSPAKNWSLSKLQKQNQELEARLEKYLKALDAADAQDQAEPPVRPLSAAQLQEKIQRLKERQAANTAKLEQMSAAGQSQLSLTDPESQSMKGAHGHVVGYNVQGAVDSKHHLLAVTEVADTVTDQGQLAPVAQAAKEALGVDRLRATADGNYYVSGDIKRCQDQGIEVHVPEVNNSPSQRAGLFGKKAFTYEAASDTYRCPAGQTLQRRRQTLDAGRVVFQYDHPAACTNCSLKAYCTKSQFRTVSRWEHEERIERMVQQMAAAPEVLAQRKELIEHCWGTFKWLLPGGFLVKGFKRVGGEVSLAHLAYNLKRALKVVGAAALMAALPVAAAGA